MHDVLESVIPKVTKLILVVLISDGHFSLDALNENINTFSFGATDSKNKPESNLSQATLHSPEAALKQSATQTWCLARHLPFLVGSMVPEGHHHWMLFLDLMHIVDILFSPVTSKGLAMYLKVLIRDFLEEFKALFPESSIIPKMHFMVHYPRCIVRLGPLVRHWCMRFEAKNSYFKRLSHGVFNFKNICKSLAFRHQKLQCYHLAEEGGYLRTYVETGTGKVVQQADRTANQKLMIQNKMGRDDDNVIFSSVKWVTIYGTKYQPGMIVVEGHDGLMPTFAEIKSLLALPDRRVFFLCKKVRVIRFVKHLWAFEVTVMNTECMLDYTSLYDFHPLDLYCINYEQALRKFVRPKYHIHD
ncbi:uncharacterized protein [Montipora foliosa]|uniref:uncharacterized protein n=1 Tax=Montipora foliosa TaxID=591990 RepID=UPI0035F15288